ncbi:cytochrome P450 71B36-like [Papaver somniferum]|uniref:cytochrome P450 71B36-like n=1 Tax=Papaver somniferum TaxID=3469 RepID=UPI000E6F778D|nr:cytochrome P450 71B36-like [Papaver somniferum]
MEILPYNFLLLLSLLLIPSYLPITIKNRSYGSRTKPNFPPGPPSSLHQFMKQPHQAIAQLSKIYGPVMFIQYGRIPTVVISSAEDAEQLFKTHDIAFCNRVQLAGRKQLSYSYVDMALVLFGEYWREIRKISALELFTKKRVQSFKVNREEEVDALIDSVSSSLDTTAVNVFEKLASFTHETTCRVAFGQTRKQFDGRLVELLREVAILTSLSPSDYFPEVSWIIDRVTGIHGKTEKCFHELDDLLQQIIDENDIPERLELEHEDIIDVLLKLMKAQMSTIRLTNDHIKAVILNIYLGGVDTTTGVMTWAMAELAKDSKYTIGNCLKD